MSKVIEALEKEQITKKVPDFSAGDTVSLSISRSLSPLSRASPEIPSKLWGASHGTTLPNSRGPPLKETV